ncbi:MAG: hypothetical protein BGO78_17205 [Chloroflexi bacterium 44-23]|nr:MAG: hypothetical protein BGO78_17205 [Chloroflexi bacterium 44-23]
MVIQYDDKGKIFTSVITKKSIKVLIQTQTHRVTGMVFYRPDDRLIDELNQTDIFLAVTDAKILDENNNVLFESNFLTVNINQIVWILPYEELAVEQVE